MIEETPLESLHAVVIEAFQQSSMWERVLARLPGFQVPWSFRFRRRGEQIRARWGVTASAHILIGARWRQAAFLLVLLGAGAFATGVSRLQLAGVVLYVMAFGCVWQAVRRRNTSGIPVTRRLRGGGNRPPL